MNHFKYEKIKGEETLFCEAVNLTELALKVGTPFYCYSQATLSRHFRVFDEAFSEIPHIICYSVKANSNLALLNLFADKGSGFDIVSGGELQRVLEAGGDPQKVVFSGVGKTRSEMIQAIQADILFFNVESEAELDVLNEVAGELNRKVRIALRVNPDIDPQTHPYISTGLKKAKFGIDIHTATELFIKAKDLSHIDVVGVDCHIGSQLTQLEPFRATLESLENLVNELRQKGLSIRYLDIGGGLGIQYSKETPPHPRDYAEIVVPFVKKLNVTLLMEPGRVIVGNSGILVSKVLYTKPTKSKNFIIVDAAMNDLIRPALYQAHQEILPVVKNCAGRTIKADVVGPICESGDFLAQDREVPDFKCDDLLAVMGAGAYGFSMSSTYNTRPRVAEVLVQGATYDVIRARENVKTLLRGEHAPFQKGKRAPFRIPFAKMHGAGNDFVVIDARNLMHNHLPWELIAKSVCDRHFGIGADQMLLLAPASREKTVASMLIYDADGSQVEMCGNGLRALGLYLWEENICRQDQMPIATADRIVVVERLQKNRFRVDMNEPILEGRKIPVNATGTILNHALVVHNKTYTLTGVSMGNPHAVIYIDGKVKDYPVREYGPQIENFREFFPNRVNVEFVEILNRSTVNCRVWERGTGETLACGSGACAVGVAGVLSKRTDRQIQVHLPGGTLEMEWNEKNNHVFLTGPSARVFEGDIDLSPYLGS